jgi:plasmid replication initiation protein
MKSRTEKLRSLLERHQSRSWLIISVVDLRNVLGVPDKYKGFSPFKRHVLMPCVDDLRKTGLFITVNVEKKQAGIGKGVRVEHIHMAFQFDRPVMSDYITPKRPESIEEFIQRTEGNTALLKATYGS